MSSTLRGLALVLIAAVVALGAPFVISGSHLFDVSQALIFAMAILGLNILTGYSGQISLGHGAFIAIGAFVPAVLTTHTDVSWGLSLPLAAVVCGLLGFLVGIPALRLEGIYLALATFALGVATPTVLLKASGLTGGVRGILLPPVTSPVGFLTDDQFFYFCCVGTLAILLLLAWNLLRGRTGRALKAIRDSEIAARAFGIDLPMHKTMAFAISAAYAGVAGALYGLSQTFVEAGQFTFLQSINILIGAIIGGIGTLEGAIFGGLFVIYLPLVAQQLPVSKQVVSAAPQVTQGLILLIVMFVARQGVAGLLRRGYYELRARLTEAPASDLGISTAEPLP